MSENETIGRMTCPICGEPLQDVRISKNGKLYVICDNNCRINFSGKQSKKWLPVLRSGQSIREDKILITALGEKKQNEYRTATIGNTGQSRGNTTIGRPDVRNTADRGISAGTVTASEKSGEKRGILAGFFDDDE